MTFDAIILAAGAGERYGGPTPKQFSLLAGVPMVVRAVRAAVDAGAARVVVVVAAAQRSEAAALFEGRLAVTPSFVTGGRTRVDSCRLGLAGLAGGDEVVVVHDAARPLAAPGLFERAVAAVRAGADAASAAIPSTDTVARLRQGDVAEILERSTLARLQTPQAFRREVLAGAHARAAAVGDTSATDDCGLVLRHAPRARVVTVPGDEANVKVTTPHDLRLAELLLAST
ncbi:MAG TPA: 2-C-methyl-D-erythritol 4-phosphate cytidylyltransferase [Candidatus Binatus sp.]|nr:2-C-methyl-D-erythritol 4-phosphate cytidylyltransferase [Candidatus Binatus sp.]